MRRILPPGAGQSPRVMGILNATPDSFSDGGADPDLGAALTRAEAMIAAGAEVIDIGGESTRPGAAPVSGQTELGRVLPLIVALRARSSIPISIDTRRAAVARAAVAAGADMWNDITGLTGDPDSLGTAAALGCSVVLMHMQGEPATMQAAPAYGDVVAEVRDWLGARAQAAMAAGVAREAIWLDPGIGFGKTPPHNLALMASLDTLAGLGFPVLLGASRKGLIRAIDPTAAEAGDRLGGSIALALAGAAAGCAMIRVHDVRQTVQALKVRSALARASDSAEHVHD